MQMPPLRPYLQPFQASSFSMVVTQLKVFLIWVCVACVYNSIVLHPYLLGIADEDYIQATIPSWISLFISSGIMLWISKAKQLSRIKLELYCNLLVFILGTGFALSVYALLQMLYQSSHQQHLSHIIVLGILPISTLYILGMVYLTQRLRYFLMFYIPTILPFLAIQWIYQHSLPTSVMTLIWIWAAVHLFLAFLAQQLHRYLKSAEYKNQQLLAYNQIQIEHHQALEQQFQSEVQKNQDIRSKLSHAEQQLDQCNQVKQVENTKLHEQLILQQAHLKFTQDAAGLASWRWNIKARRFEINADQIDLDLSILKSPNFNILSLIHPEDKALYKSTLRQHLRGFTDRFELRYRIQNNGQWHWVEHVGRVIGRDPLKQHALNMVGIFRNIHQERKNLELVNLSATIFNQVAEGIFVLDSNLCYLDVNPYYEKLIGIKRSELIGKHLFDVTQNHRPDIQQQHLLLVRNLRNNAKYDSEVVEEYISGKKLNLWMQISTIKDDRSNVSHYVGITTDLTDRKKQEQRLSYLENYNLLTDLPNRFYFHLKLHHIINHNAGLDHFAVIRINIDRFRLINEYLNNDAGDELLRLAAHRLRQCCKDAELVSYFNNDDFAVLVNLGHNSNGIHAYAQNILLNFQQAFEVHDKEHNISISLGIALYPEHTTQLNNLINHADMALANAKRLGGNTSSFYNHHHTLMIDDNNQLKHDLKNAIKNSQLVVYYQPQICTQTTNIIGFEALIRWNHPTRGLISPEMFIPLAEETSLISEIGQYVIFQSCKQLQLWSEMGFAHIRVSVNIVAQQIHRGHLLIDLDTAMSMYRIRGEQLSLEITESSLLDQSDAVVKLLEEIRQRQISISLDDFGTGYSSLAYLTLYPIDTLKIDKAFVSKIGLKKEGAIVDAIVAMAKSMSLSLIAEGVETRAHMEYLKALDCDAMQGFYFSKPLNAEESTLYLQQYRAH